MRIGHRHSVGPVADLHGVFKRKHVWKFVLVDFACFASKATFCSRNAKERPTVDSWWRATRSNTVEKAEILSQSDGLFGVCVRIHSSIVSAWLVALGCGFAVQHLYCWTVFFYSV